MQTLGVEVMIDRQHEVSSNFALTLNAHRIFGCVSTDVIEQTISVWHWYRGTLLTDHKDHAGFEGILVEVEILGFTVVVFTSHVDIHQSSGEAKGNHTRS